MLNLQGQMKIIIRGEMKNEKLGRRAKLRKWGLYLGLRKMGSVEFALTGANFA